MEELFFVHVDYPSGEFKMQNAAQRPTIQLIIKEEMLGLSVLLKGF